MHQVKTEYPPLSVLRADFGRNKTIPSEYEEVVLKALSHYPELKNTRIVFQKKNDHPVPYGTVPTRASYLKTSSGRKYVITLQEEAEPPVKLALFKNLPEEAQRAVIGHELAHVLQFHKHSIPKMLGSSLSYSAKKARREVERAADLTTIEHGLGFELFVHAVYIRKIPGYTLERKNIETDYLKPQEILDTLPEGTPA
jgi:hypothetical protein